MICGFLILAEIICGFLMPTEKICGFLISRKAQVLEIEVQNRD